LHLNVDIIDDLLAGLGFPDSVASDHEEVCFV
jgi:hypothetical protein